jgi:hypothetical protein
LDGRAFAYTNCVNRSFSSATFIPTFVLLIRAREQRREKRMRENKLTRFFKENTALKTQAKNTNTVFLGTFRHSSFL